MTLFATQDSQSRARLSAVAPQPYEEERSLDPWVWTALHVGHAFEEGRELDLLHSHLDFLPLTYSRLVEVPLLTTIHGFSSPRIHPAYQAYDDRSYYVSISYADRHPALQYLATIYNGIDLDQFTFRPQGGDDLVWLGRIHPEKGVHLAIEVARRTRRRLVLAGIVHDREYFEEQIRPHVDGRQIEFVGPVGPAERDELLGSALAFLHPVTRPERFGLTMVEAMACGTPVIGMDRGAVREVIGPGTGFLVRSVEEAADAVGRVGQLDRGRCRTWVEERFSRERMVDDYIRGYERILAGEVRPDEPGDEVPTELLDLAQAEPGATEVGARAVSAPIYPPLKLDHLRRLTDGTGLLEHALYSVPRSREGYTTDDNARALQVAVRHHRLTGDVESLELARRYLAFLAYAQRKDGRFHNDLAYDRTWQDELGPEDVQGRAALALAEAAASPVEDVAQTARELWAHFRPWIGRVQALRPRALVLRALRAWLDVEPADAVAGRVLSRHSEALLASYRATAGPGWWWFEDHLTYANALLPHGLLAAWEVDGGEDRRDCARQSLAWLLEVTFPDGKTFEPVGQDGWYVRGQARARFDQQPIEAQVLAEVCLDAHRLLGEERLWRCAVAALEWFLGRNVHGLALYDEETGGCRDGLTRDGINANQGAESTLAFLLAYLAFLEAEGAHPASRRARRSASTGAAEIVLRDLTKGSRRRSRGSSPGRPSRLGAADWWWPQTGG